MRIKKFKLILIRKPIWDTFFNQFRVVFLGINFTFQINTHIQWCESLDLLITLHFDGIQKLKWSTLRNFHRPLFDSFIFNRLRLFALIDGVVSHY